MRISDWSSDVCSSDLFDRWTLQPVAHERYDDGNWRQKIGASMFALHRGSFFGTGGVVLFMVTSFGMPLFAVTGWMLYLDRRRRKRVVREVSDSIAGQPLALPPAPRSEEHTSELQSLMRTSYSVFC